MRGFRDYTLKRLLKKPPQGWRLILQHPRDWGPLAEGDKGRSGYDEQDPGEEVFLPSSSRWKVLLLNRESFNGKGTCHHPTSSETEVKSVRYDSILVVSDDPTTECRGGGGRSRWQVLGPKKIFYPTFSRPNYPLTSSWSNYRESLGGSFHRLGLTDVERNLKLLELRRNRSRDLGWTVNTLSTFSRTNCNKIPLEKPGILASPGPFTFLSLPLPLPCPPDCALPFSLTPSEREEVMWMKEGGL